MTTTVRAMRREERDVAIDLAAAEGWNPGLHDAAAFWEADPEGFLVAEVDGELAGCIRAVSYEGVFGFIGLFTVRPHLRGGGPGSRLWAAGAERLASHLVGLDGVLAQQDYYRRKGFTLAWQNARFGGEAAGRDGPRLVRGWSAARVGADQEVPGGTQDRTAGSRRWPSPSACTRWPARLPPGTRSSWTCRCPTRQPASWRPKRMAPGFETARMHTGAVPTIELDRSTAERPSSSADLDAWPRQAGRFAGGRMTDLGCFGRTSDLARASSEDVQHAFD